MNDQLWQSWMAKLEWLRKCLEKKGCFDFRLTIKPPVDRSVVDEFEKVTGLGLPDDYVAIITHYAGSVRLCWFLTLNKDVVVTGLPVSDPAFQNYLLGRLRTDMDPDEYLKREPSLIRKIKQGWIHIVPPDDYGPSCGGDVEIGSTNPLRAYNEFQAYLNQDDTVEAIKRENPFYTPKQYAGLMPIWGTGGGDCIAMDLADNRNPIIYLDHEGSYGPSSTTRIGQGYSDFLTRFINLGCPDSEFAIEHYLDLDTDQLDDQCENATLWIHWLESQLERGCEVDVWGSMCRLLKL